MIKDTFKQKAKFTHFLNLLNKHCTQALLRLNAGETLKAFPDKCNSVLFYSVFVPFL